MAARSTMTIEEVINEVVMFSGRFPDLPDLEVFDFVEEVCGVRVNQETAWGKAIIAAYDHGTEEGLRVAKAYGVVS